jgi:addiction module HigA family antidote
VHPGEILREEFMKPLGLSINKLSLDLRVPLTRIADIVNGRRRVTVEYRAAARSLFQEYSHILDEPADALRPGSCGG